MRIRPFDFSDADYAALVRVNEAAWPDQPDSESFWRRQDTYREPTQRFHRWMAETADGIIGYASSGHNPYNFHPRRFLVDVRVDAARQGQGIGAALYDHLIATTAEHDLIALEAITRDDLDRAIRFLEDRGFALTGRDATTELDVSSLDFDAYQALFERLTERGISISTWSELLGEPDAERQLHRLMNVTQRDVPGQDEPTDQGFDDWVQSYSDENPDFLPDTLVVARDGDRWLGMSQIWASQASDDIYYTGFTGVRREARRQGLATALKVASISGLPAASPGSPGPFVRAQNEENNPMLQINLRLGFEPRPAALLHYAKAIEAE